MANPEHLAKLKEGVQAWNEWRSVAKVVVDLTSADLRSMDLRNVDLFNADLSLADLRDARLNEANLSGAILTDSLLRDTWLNNANLQRANLHHSYLQRADLSGANLFGARLYYANLGETKMNGTDLRAASLQTTLLNDTELGYSLFGYTTIADTDLSQALGLDLANHAFASSIGIDTLYRSKGRIPEKFLQGCGVPREFLDLANELFSRDKSIQFYSCFISYSHKDQEFAERLCARLRAKDLRVWFAPEEMKGGGKLFDQIDEAIRIHDKLLLVLSDASILSEWVMTEIRRARKRELKEKRQVLFPIRLTVLELLRSGPVSTLMAVKTWRRKSENISFPIFPTGRIPATLRKGLIASLRTLENLKTRQSGDQSYGVKVWGHANCPLWRMQKERGYEMKEKSKLAQSKEKMIEVRVRFWTNNIAKKKGKIIPKRSWDSGVVHMQRNASHGIIPKNPRPFHSMMNLSAVIEKVLIAHGIELRSGKLSGKYFKST